MEICDVVIIGSGPAGLFTAINCSGDDRKVVILEKNKTAGRKLLLSGAGQCNLTHDGSIKEFLNHYGENGRFLRHVLYNFNNDDLLDFFRKRGLDFISNENGKIFPETLKAFDILNILLKECEKRRVDIRYNKNVKGVIYDKEERKFKIKTVEKVYKSNFLVIATGGKSYGATGSTGDGYRFANSLGHTIEPLAPSLTPLFIKKYPFKELSGISFENVFISLWRNNRKIRETVGDVLLTHRNISGPGILNFSRYVVAGDVIKINFVRTENEEDFRSEFVRKLQSNGKIMIKTFLKEYLLPKRFVEKILKIAGIEEEKCSQLSKEKRNELIKMLVSFPMEVEKLGDYHIAMATRGGVSLKEVNHKTMESKILKRLYFAGEVLDVDGDTGGYNLQAAFSMGYAAGRDIAKNL
ncbi:hypothetical protein SAMN02745883_01863 [Caminicella sporogenes DSM 14501]|uniref:NAD(P)/FAD-dependent oxidoreductase n=1 Tax=Caminicella sporogenes DSM 14501 TaxID=1121266 RepID=A0A1M6RRY4_9FIRM|nr:NAD(P)/FAD-dependent oxidoreductase [Caminicella sporogenes]RKD23663.1 hypothetical protein BET04_04510 [Caminicella sporogenes]SHK35272.1 hypothetical protein SAMN02745883_01863 [Caminicella sporogenes DSM 14501]